MELIMQDLIQTGFAKVDRKLVPDDVVVFAIGDVHGHSEALGIALAHIASVTTAPGKRRVLVHLGDVLDRGPDSIGAIRMLMNAKGLAQVDEVVLLPGNHELMFFDMLDAPDENENGALWLLNGGLAVLKEVKDLTPGDLDGDPVGTIARHFEQDAELAAWMLEMRTAPPSYAIGDLIFIHAGLHPKVGIENTLDMPREGHRRNSAHHWAWVRDKFLSWQFGWDGKVIVHGHTCAFKKPVLWHEDESWLEKRMDRVATHSRINLDAAGGKRDHVGGVCIDGNTYEIFVAQAGVVGAAAALA
jgi:serine/threonine protein phosphatase 1